MDSVMQHQDPMVPAYSDHSEDDILSSVLYPSDSYTPEHVYWADLPFSQKVKFVTKVDREENGKEWAATKALFSKQKMGPVKWYFKNAIVPGAGLGLEGFVLFSIGNLTTLFGDVWKRCWTSYEVCSEVSIQLVTIMEIVGIIFGQIIVGILGDRLGRRYGLIQDAVVMFLGLLLLIGSWGADLQGWVIMYIVALFIYGVGVGGEYPMTATASMENSATSGKVSNRDDRLHRGRKVTLAFLMQGWGQVLNQAWLLILLVAFDHGGGAAPYTSLMGHGIFRLSFVPIAFGTAWLVYYRWFKMPLASKQLNLVKAKSNVTGYDIESLKLVFGNFGGRLLATAGTWYCNDVFFYGNKLFQSAFLKVLYPQANILTTWEFNLLNCAVSLIGYYLACFMIDNKLYGRKMMMQVGFLADFILFVVPAFHYTYFTGSQGIHAFQAMYYLSSFFNQFGPNSVTFLVAAEVFPTGIRATAHGFGAAVGKLGALTATVLYNYIDTETKFMVVPWFGLAGMLLTFFFLPDTTGLDLKEQERYWQCIRSGRINEYHGVAIHPQHLSLWEKFRGVHKNYNPELDHQKRVIELKSEWVEMIQEHHENEKNDQESFFDVEQFPPDVHAHMKRIYHVNPEAGGKGVPLEEKETGELSLSSSESDEINEKRSAL
ncbi:major facilitator superfamily domain-containing protein [Calycina marina]|uniref:Major facilitator superfamily domain-containing protein n=1 Tax=Calycina marina TaxID=1763456 RepID=A0A9P7Z623_9HELO|nr:major facilitator superfamily domain-containing protein [Calycina marina]